MSVTISGPPTAGREAADDAIEYETTIRGQRVSCWLEGGELAGDPELVERVRRASDGRELGDPVELAQLVNDAVGSHVTIRFSRSGGVLEIR